VGETIEQRGRATVGEVVILTLDRNLTSMATRSFDHAPAEAPADDFVARLARRIFAADADVTRVYAAANVIQVTRTGGWDTDAEGAIGAVVADLYRFYD
jgi:hypothetical protein